MIKYRYERKKRNYKFHQKKAAFDMVCENYDKLNDESIVEHILNYGDWKDVQKLFSILGIKKRLKFLENK